MTPKVIIDTNLWISFLISHRFIQLDTLILDRRIRLLFSGELIEEILEVSSRPKFQNIFKQKDILMMINLIKEYGEEISVESKVAISSDPYDNFLLALAKDGQADYLITGDKALIDLHEFSGTKILPYTTFIQLLAN